MQAVLADHLSAPISDAEKALFTFIEKVNRHSTAITADDIEALRQLGWSEEELYYAITVCALFNFYNRWVDATGVQDMPSYETSGKRSAAQGYITKWD